MIATRESKAPGVDPTWRARRSFEVAPCLHCGGALEHYIPSLWEQTFPGEVVGRCTVCKRKEGRTDRLPRCGVCSAPFEARRQGGVPQRYCGAECRAEANRRKTAERHRLVRAEQRRKERQRAGRMASVRRQWQAKADAADAQFTQGAA